MALHVPCRLTRDGNTRFVSASLGRYQVTCGGSDCRVPYTDITEVWQFGHFVHIRWANGEARLDMGDHRRATRYAHKMEEAPSPLEALGAKRGDLVAVMGLPESWLFRLVRSRKLTALAAGTDAKPVDMLVVGVADRRSLASLNGLLPFLRKDGHLWLVYPRDDRDIEAQEVLAAGRALDFRDVLELQVSPQQSALKFVAAG
ncbi:MAG: hypothetical protein LC620_00300 [Halobacteriales archaeon]|nr:hypothetical protein [Halobacteriales archaeon]